MKKIDFNFESRIPEQCSVSFKSTGSMGGDAGHGGSATLKISGNEDMIVNLSDGNGDEKKFENVGQLSLTVRGDWELEGLAVALLDIGRKLLSRDDVLRRYVDTDDREE